jgi:ABC-2 type transport system ATP-binding protein
MRQRLALARSMVHDPELLILDEPTSGVDPSGQIQIRKIMLDLAKKEKKTIFLSSHNLDEVQRICNRIAIIDRGEIKLYGKLEDLRRQMGKMGLVIKTVSDIPRKVIDDIKKDPALGLRKFQERKLVFLPDEGIGTPEILNALSGHGVEVDEAIKQEATLEEMYSKILKEAEEK